MPANISVVNGQAEMMYAGEAPWHKLGTRVSGLVTSHEALVAAHMDWEVVKKTLYTEDSKLVDSHVATVRSDTGTILGVVGANYQPIQNADAFSLMDNIVGENLAMFDTAGVLGKGNKVWMLAKIPEKIAVADRDPLDTYLMLANGHDGKFGLTLLWTEVRVVCQNTLNVALSTGRKKFFAKHTLNIDSRIDAMREMLGFGREYMAEYLKEAEKLVKYIPTKDNVTEYFGKLYQVDLQTVAQIINNEKAPKGTTEKSIKDSFVLFQSGKGNDAPGIANTAWALFNGTTEYLDYYLPMRKDEKEERRLEKSWFGASADSRQKAWELATVMSQ